MNTWDFRKVIEDSKGRFVWWMRHKFGPRSRRQTPIRPGQVVHIRRMSDFKVLVTRLHTPILTEIWEIRKGKKK